MPSERCLLAGSGVYAATVGRLRVLAISGYINQPLWNTRVLVVYRTIPPPNEERGEDSRNGLPAHRPPDPQRPSPATVLRPAEGICDRYRRQPISERSPAPHRTLCRYTTLHAPMPGHPFSKQRRPSAYGDKLALLTNPRIEPAELA
ncbi:hypothetical protein OH77DRAFT_880131 [Trametes cingulata]|nr:hypothetical protein OH77DRAFT_880131 [Trametes cingulata]